MSSSHTSGTTFGPALTAFCLCRLAVWITKPTPRLPYSLIALCRAISGTAPSTPTKQQLCSGSISTNCEPTKPFSDQYWRCFDRAPRKWVRQRSLNSGRHFEN